LVVYANNISPDASPKFTLALRERDICGPGHLESLIKDIGISKESTQRFARKRMSERRGGGFNRVQLLVVEQWHPNNRAGGYATEKRCSN